MKNKKLMKSQQLQNLCELDQNNYYQDEQENPRNSLENKSISAQQSDDDLDYDDLFEDARREEVLRSINQNVTQNQNQDSEEKHQQMEVILKKRAQRQQKHKMHEKNNEMKILRQQNAMQFFRKVKMQMLLSFRNSVLKAKTALNQSHTKIPQLLSCCRLDTLKLYQNLRNKKYIKRDQFIELVRQIFQNNDIQLNNKNQYSLIFSLAFELQIGLRKISFVDISAMDLQSFYNLKYNGTKNKKKKINKELDILKNRLQKKVAQQQLKDHKFINIQQYSFNAKSSNSELTQTQSVCSTKQFSQTSSSQLQKIKKIKKTFSQSYCMIFCPVQNNWDLFNMQTLQTQNIQQMKTLILQGKSIIGFYSIRPFHFHPCYKFIQKQRTLGSFQIRDLTLDFCDKHELIIKRRHRLGCKGLYRALIKDANVFKCLRIFSQFDKKTIIDQRKKQIDWALSNFPKSIKQMKISDYFVTPSLVQKYMILKQNAQPIPNIQFHEQKVYYKADLQRVSSRMGWVDQNRMIKQGQIPLKTTQNKNKTTTRLYKFTQTQPFILKITEQGQFCLDEQYNSIYVPPFFDIPTGFTLVTQNVQYICKKNKYKCARLVQGFIVQANHLIPNNIGYLVQQKCKQQILEIYRERQQKLMLKKQSRKIESAMTLWRKLFKSIIITQQVYRN